MPATIHTERLIMRRWTAEDGSPFAAINADPEVVACLPGPLTRAESDLFVERIEAHFGEHGFGLWALEVVGGPSLIGYAGLLRTGFDAHFTPAVEIGWRLARSAWGLGYATEAARAALDYGFDVADLDEVVSFTVPANTRSRAVMERLGMTHEPRDDFDHPSLPQGHPLRRHVLYRIGRNRHYSRG